MMNNKHRLVTALLLVVMSTPVVSAQEANNEAKWQQLNRDLQARNSELASLMSEAKSRDITIAYASVSAEAIAVFQVAAQHDWDHLKDNRLRFSKLKHHALTSTTYADNLPYDELQDCVTVADRALAQLRQQLDGKIVLSSPPDLAKGSLKLGSGGYYLLDGRPIFPSSLSWMPHDKNYMQAFGYLGGDSYELTNLKENGTINERNLDNYIASAEKEKQLHVAPYSFFLGHTAAQWMKTQHPEILQGGRLFTKYDIDSTLVRGWLQDLFASTLPAWSKAAGDMPELQLLANEPSFSTAKGQWLAGNGVSAITLQKYRLWVAAKYKTVAELNKTYHTSYKSLDQVAITVPIDPALRGGPVWYDWCRFNMDRVDNWFAFLKKGVQANDIHHSPVTIKILGPSLGDSTRDQGIDIEYLTKLQDIDGSDLRAAPRDAHFSPKQSGAMDPKSGWTSRYSYDWIDQSMALDFTKSLCPHKLFYDSEWHGLGANSWQDTHMNANYIHSALWLAFTHGMGAMQAWVWDRKLDGSFSHSPDEIGQLSTQPIALDAYGQTFKELNAHASEVISAVPSERHFLIYYSEDTAIQSDDYMAQLREVYVALKLLNVSIGFAPADEVAGIDTKTQTLIVSPTAYISEANLNRLRLFQRSGGRIILVGADKSFLKTELGVTRTDRAIKGVFASIPMKDASQLVEEFTKALGPIQSPNPVNISITDEGGKKAYGVIVSESSDSQTGATTIVLNNVSKDPRDVTLTARHDPSGKLMNLITHQQEMKQVVMAPCDVLVLRYRCSSTVCT